MPTDWLDGIGMEEEAPSNVTVAPNEAGRRDSWGSPFVDNIIGTLEGAGWTVTEQHKPMAHLLLYPPFVPIGVSSWGAAKVDVNCAARGGVFYFDLTTTRPTKDSPKIIYYDPLKENMPECPAFALGHSVSETIDNFIEAITAFTQFDAELNPDYHDSLGFLQAVLTAKISGTELNNSGFYASGGWVTYVTYPSGGGKTLRSAEYRGRSITVKVTEIDGTGEYFRALLEFSGGITQRLQTRRQHGAYTNQGYTTDANVFRIIASAHQLCIYAPNGEPTHSSQLLASIPWAPFDSEPVPVIIGHARLPSNEFFPGGQPQLRTQLAYRYAWLNGQYVTGNAVQLGCLRGYPGYDVKTMDGEPLTNAAYIYGRPAGSKREDGRVLGKIWNGLMSLDAQSGDLGSIGGRTFARIGTQQGNLDNWVRGTFWLMVRGDEEE